MLNFIFDTLKLIKWYHVVIVIALLLLSLILWLLIHIFKHRYLQKNVWFSRSDDGVHKTMDEQESLRYIRKVGQRHLSEKSCSSNIIRRIQWSVYLQLQVIRRKLSKVPADYITMLPSSLWLFENFHLMYRELKKFQETGGANRFRKLPAIKNGKLKGYPRIYALAREIIFSNHHLDEETISRLLIEYQKESELKTAELWILQNTLSLCLLEEIILESKNILSTINTKKRAETEIKKIIPQIAKNEERLTDLMKRMLSKEQTDDHAFLAHIVQRLRELAIDDVDLADWLNDLHKEETETGFDWLIEIVNYEGRHEAAEEAVIRTLIISLKSVGDLNWEEMFQKTSQLDIVLCKDPTNVFKSMDMKSKGQYRTVIEKLSEKFKVQETTIAEAALRISLNAQEGKEEQRKNILAII